MADATPDNPVPGGYINLSNRLHNTVDINRPAPPTSLGPPQPEQAPISELSQPHSLTLSLSEPVIQTVPKLAGATPSLTTAETNPTKIEFITGNSCHHYFPRIPSEYPDYYQKKFPRYNEHQNNGFGIIAYNKDGNFNGIYHFRNSFYEPATIAFTGHNFIDQRVTKNIELEAGWMGGAVYGYKPDQMQFSLKMGDRALAPFAGVVLGARINLGGAEFTTKLLLNPAFMAPVIGGSFANTGSENGQIGVNFKF